MMPIRCSRRKSPKTNAYRALVWSVAPSVRPRCHRAYSSHECDLRNAFWSLARGCTFPQSLLSTYWPVSMRCWAHATPSGFTEYEATAVSSPDIARAIRRRGTGSVRRSRDAPAAVGADPGTRAYVSASAALPGWLEAGGPRHARRAALRRDHQGHLARCLVDHLVAEHGRPPRAAFGRDGPVVRVKDQLRVVVVLLGRGEDLVGRGDLVRVQHPLSVKTKRRRPPGRGAEPVGVAYLRIGAVDRLQVPSPGGHQDAHEDVVVGIGGISRRLLPDHQRSHPDGGHEVRGTEDDGLQPG